MEIELLQNAGTFEILTQREHLREQLLNIERAGRTCYQSDRHRVITRESAARFCLMLIARGHESVLEHSSMTVRFDNHSRGFTHELVRHRLASFSQESTRYVDYAVERNDVRAVVPPNVASGDNWFSEGFREAFFHYTELREGGVPAEDARQILPIGMKSEIVMTANLREWRHVFGLRCDKFAHWEIRRTMCRLLETCKHLLPGVFDDFVLGGEHRGVLFYVRKLPKGVLKRQLELAEVSDA